MLHWQAKEFEFRSQIFQLEDQRIKRLKVGKVENEVRVGNGVKGGCQEYFPMIIQDPTMRLNYEIKGSDIFRGDSSIVRGIWKNQSRKVNDTKVTIDDDTGRIVQWNHWMSIIEPQYLLLPIPLIEDPNLNFLRSIYVDLRSSVFMLYPTRYQRMIHHTHSSLSLTISGQPWAFNPTWLSWISPFSPGAKKTHQSHLDQLLLSVDVLDQKIIPTSFFLISALKSSPVPIQLLSNSPNDVVAPRNYVREINSATMCPAPQKTIDHSWLLSIRVCAPYSCIDQFQRMQTNILLSDVGDLAATDNFFPEDSSLPLAKANLECAFYHFLMDKMILTPISFEIKKSSYQLHPPGHHFDIIQHILSVSNQLVYIAKVEPKLSRNWIYRSLCDSIRILTTYQPNFRSLHVKKSQHKIVDNLLPISIGAQQNFHEVDLVLDYFRELDPKTRNSLPEKDNLTQEECSNTTTPQCSSIETHMEVSYQESKSCEIVSSVEVHRQTPSPTETTAIHIESKTLEEGILEAYISEKQLANLQFVEIGNVTRQPQQANMGDIIDSYLQLHDSDTPNLRRDSRDLHQIHCSTTRILTPPPLLHARESSSASHFSTDPMEGLTILVSEDLLVQNPIYSTLLSQKYKIQCASVPLESPLAFIVDEITGICLLFDELFSSRERLKKFLRNLTSLVFKFNTIWLVIVSLNDMKIPYDIFASLCQSLTQFPCSIEIRFSHHLSVPSMVHSLCQEAATFIAVNKGVLLSTFKDRTMMKLFDNMVFSAHCKSADLH